jgi:hypothetical protein
MMGEIEWIENKVQELNNGFFTGPRNLYVDDLRAALTAAFLEGRKSIPDHPRPASGEGAGEVGETLKKLKKVAVCIHIAVEKSVAEDVAATCLDAITAIQSLSAQYRWRPIETCPSDRVSLVCDFTNGKKLVIASWGRSRLPTATHWMPLPEPPAALAKDGEG